MLNLYDKNGFIFWTEKEIKAREMLKCYFVDNIRDVLKDQNKAFEIYQIEAPILTPLELINPNYSNEDLWITDTMVLRPETTMGSYKYANYLLRSGAKTKLPFCIWQHGKSFRMEQDFSLKFMRLKEFYQLEFQIIYGETTMNDYSLSIIPVVQSMISKMIGKCKVEPSDRLPDYSEWTQDIIHEESNMEVCSISFRKDFNGAKNLEVAIGTDRCVSLFHSNEN